MANIDSGHIVNDINSIPPEKQGEYRPNPEELTREVELALAGKAEATIDPTARGPVQDWMRNEREDRGPKEVGLEKAIEQTLSLTYPLHDKMQKDLDNRFQYHAPHPDQIPRYESLRSHAYVLACAIVRYTPPSREQALALTKLEEAVMHANSGIAREPK